VNTILAATVITTSILALLTIVSTDIKTIISDYNIQQIIINENFNTQFAVIQANHLDLTNTLITLNDTNIWFNDNMENEWIINKQNFEKSFVYTKFISSNFTHALTQFDQMNEHLEKIVQELSDFRGKVLTIIAETEFTANAAEANTVDTTLDACIYDPLGAGPIECVGSQFLEFEFPLFRLEPLE
jgi:hypothetical protein